MWKKKKLCLKGNKRLKFGVHSVLDKEMKLCNGENVKIAVQGLRVQPIGSSWRKQIFQLNVLLADWKTEREWERPSKKSEFNLNESA